MERTNGVNIFGRRDASASPIQTTPTYFRFDTCAWDRRRRRRRRRRRPRPRPRPRRRRRRLFPLLPSLHVAQRVPQDPVTPLAGDLGGSEGGSGEPERGCNSA